MYGDVAEVYHTFHANASTRFYTGKFLELRHGYANTPIAGEAKISEVFGALVLHMH